METTQKPQLFVFNDGFKWKIVDQAFMPPCPQCGSTNIVVMVSSGVIHGYCIHCKTHLTPEGSNVITRDDIGGAIGDCEAGTDRGSLPSRPPASDGD